MLLTTDQFETVMAHFLNDLTKRKCLTVSPNAPIERVLSTLSSNSIGAQVVQNKQGIVFGIISERDIILSLAERQSRDGLVVDDMMTRKFISIEPNSSSAEIMKIMTKKKLRHLPIISKNNSVGIVSIGDVVQYLIKKYHLEAEQIRSFISR